MIFNLTKPIPITDTPTEPEETVTTATYNEETGDLFLFRQGEAAFSYNVENGDVTILHNAATYNEETGELTI